MNLNTVVAGVVRAAAILLGTIGTLFLLLTGYVSIVAVPELVVGTAIGGVLATASIFLWKKANKIHA